MTRCQASVCGIAVAALLFGLPAARAAVDPDLPTDFSGADLNVGERLFLETRFSHYFFTNSLGDPNGEISGEPLLNTIKTTNGFASGPFAGQAMNCRQCHLVDEKGYGQFGDL